MPLNIESGSLSHLRQRTHNLGKNVQRNRLTFALTIIGLIGLSAAAVGLAALGLHQGWWSAGALTSVSQVNAIRTMAVGGSVFFSGLVAIVLSSVCRKSHVENVGDKIVDPSDSDMPEKEAEVDSRSVMVDLEEDVSEEDKALQTTLESWVIKGWLGEERSEAMKHILAFVNDPEKDELILSSLFLTSLPDVFDHQGFEKLKKLMLNGSRLETLPDSISSLKALESLDLDFNSLKEFPPGFGGLTNLHTLSLTGNKLKELPVSFGELTNLRTLDLVGNSLEALPADFGGLINLQELHLSENFLKELPAGFGDLTNLHTLHLDRNSLEALPAEFGRLTNLHELYLFRNSLEALPGSIGSLFSLEYLNLVSNPSLTNLPDEILSLPNGCEIDISGTGLSTQCLTTLRTAVSVEGYAGPRFSHAILENPLSVPDRPAKELLGTICEVTEHPSMEFEQLLGHEKKSTLELWLNKLSYIAEFKNGAKLQKALLKHVITYLELAEKDASFCEKFFLILSEATGTCGDRMALSILQLAVAHQLSTMKLSDCNKVADFLIRGVWAIDILREHAMKKVKSLKFFDEIEVYLAFPIKLKKALGLPIPLEDMKYFNLSSVTEQDLEEARKDVEKALADIDAKCQFLIGQDKWLEALSQNHTEKVQQLKDKLADNDYSPEAVEVYNKDLLELTKMILPNNS